MALQWILERWPAIAAGLLHTTPASPAAIIAPTPATEHRASLIAQESVESDHAEIVSAEPMAIESRTLTRPHVVRKEPPRMLDLSAATLPPPIDPVDVLGARRTNSGGSGQSTEVRSPSPAPSTDDRTESSATSLHDSIKHGSGAFGPVTALQFSPFADAHPRAAKSLSTSSSEDPSVARRILSLESQVRLRHR